MQRSFNLLVVAVFSVIFLASQVALAEPGGSVRFWRLWNPVSSDHLYTTSSAERAKAVTELGYQIEDELIYVFRRRGNGRVPLYRYWSAKYSDHFYTTLGGAKKLPDYNYEGIAAWVYNTAGDGRVRLFRFYNPSTNHHFYTSRASSVDGFSPGLLGTFFSEVHSQ